MESRFLFWCKESINKNTFHKKTSSTSIDKVEIKRIVLFNKTSYDNKGLFKYYI